MSKVWIVKSPDGSTSRQAAKRPGRRAGSGAVKKAALRKHQLERDLAVERRKRIERALTGLTRDLPRTADGHPVERLRDVRPSPAAIDVGLDVEVPGARHRPGAVLKHAPRRVSYGDVFRGPVIVNGRELSRDDDGGADVIANDVHKF